MFILVSSLGRPEVEPKTPLAQRLRRVRQDLGDPERDEFAQSLGIHKNTLAYYERGDRTPDAEVLRSYRDRCHVDMNWLVTGEGEPFEGRGGSEIDRPTGGLTDLSQPGMIAIPRYDEVRPSAGHGTTVADEQPSTRVAVEQRWLNDIGVQTSSAVILAAQGDSMEPTIRNGSPMLIDTSKTEIKNGYIYVISVGDDLLVKRIRRRLDGMIELISDNATYAPEALTPDRLSQLRVIGRVYAALSKF